MMNYIDTNQSEAMKIYNIGGIVVVNIVDTVEVTTRGGKRAIFKRTEQGWAPDWIYKDERQLVRFKDHEWLSIGHVHPRFAHEYKPVKGGGAIFVGHAQYGSTPVAWQMTIVPDRLCDGLLIETQFIAQQTIELFEAFTTFETAYDYDGSEHSLACIGQNPIVQWQGQKQITPAPWRHPAWGYSPEAVPMTGPCNAPYLCHLVHNADGSNGRCISIAADWNVCNVQELSITPTRTPGEGRSNEAEFEHVDKRGYTYVAGAFKGGSALRKSPNLFFAARRKHRQRLILMVDVIDPAISFDTILMNTWERAKMFDLPLSGMVVASERHRARGVSWQGASAWLSDVFTSGKRCEGFFDPQQGFPTYAPGTHPKLNAYAWRWWPQWSGALHYRALLLGDSTLESAATAIDETYARQDNRQSWLPSMRWIANGGKGTALTALLKPCLEESLLSSIAENDMERSVNLGTQADQALTFFLASQSYDEVRFSDQAFVLLGEVNAALENDFWAFNGGARGDMCHGGMARPFGYGNAIGANLHAFHSRGNEQFRLYANRFARLMAATRFTTHNNSADADFDWRGWATDSNGGRDQYAEFPPLETSVALLYLAELADGPKIDDGLYDLLWYFKHTGLAQFPAARTLKRGYDERAQNIMYVPRDKIASEKDFYDVLPYLAYENPLDQTMLTPHQGSDCIITDLCYGGGLVRTSDERLLVVVPRVAQLDPVVAYERAVIVWNPTGKRIDAEVSTVWPDLSTEKQTIRIEDRHVMRLEFKKKC